MRNLKFAFGISLLVSSIVNAGITTTDGENIPGPSSIEEAEEWQDRAETYGTGLPVNAQPTINSSSDMCQVFADYLNDIPNINSYEFDILMQGIGDAVRLTLNNNVGEIDIGGGQVAHVNYVIGSPVFTNVDCIQEQGRWHSSVQLEVPVTIEPWLSKSKSGTIDMEGRLTKDGVHYYSGLPVYSDRGCFKADEVTVNVQGLDFWLKAIIKGAVPGSYCESWNDVWPF